MICFCLWPKYSPFGVAGQEKIWGIRKKIKTANGKWQMANGKWQMANGKWQTANGKRQTNQPCDVITRSILFFRF